MNNDYLEPDLPVDVRKLTRRYGKRLALDAVTFRVRPGEQVGLLGPNGGGKTTLFRILATLIAPSSGDASVFGRSVTREPDAVRARLGVVFQSPSLDPKLTVAENLRHHAHLHGLRGATMRERRSGTLRALGVEERAADLVETLSGGLQRRVELAKSLLHRPDLLLLDEPTTGLDPNARRDFLDHLQTLVRSSGVTVLMTTHLMEEAERCDRVGILHEGRLAAFDAPGRLTAALGGQVVVIRCDHPVVIASRIRERFGLSPDVLDGSVRIETARDSRLTGDLAGALAEDVTSMSWGEPTLDDVFVRLTGRRLSGTAV